MHAMNDSTIVVDSDTKVLQHPSRLNLTATPQQNGQLNTTINTQTVVLKKRARQLTVTVENSQTSKEIDDIFDQVQKMTHLENSFQCMEEIQRQLQKLFAQKEQEWAYKLHENKQVENDELAICKIKLKAAEQALSHLDEFTKQLNTKAQSFIRPNSSNALQAFQNAEGINGGPVTPQSSGRSLSPNHMAEIVKERDTLREEYGQLENSYSDLFKRYEKMRENCVLLKNSEEELKTMVEENTAKYERLLARYQELRDSATQQLNEANIEIQRIIKQHEENTLGLRCRLKMNESQIQTLNLTIQGKNAQIDDLNNMVEELMKKGGIVDTVDDDETSLTNGGYN